MRTDVNASPADRFHLTPCQEAADAMIQRRESGCHPQTAKVRLKDQAHFSILAEVSVEEAAEAVVWAEAGGHICYANRSACRLLGYSREELLLRRMQDLEPSEPMPAWQSRWEHFREAEIYSFDGYLRRRDGMVIDVAIGGWYVNTGAGEYVVLSLHHDSASTPAITALPDEKHLFKILMENVPDSIYFKDRHSRFVRISNALAEYFGLTNPAQAIGTTDFDFFAEGHARQAYQDEQQILKTGRPILGKAEKEIRRDGRERWVATAKMPLLDSGGAIVGTFGISRNITKSKLAEEALRASEQFNKRILESTSDGVCVLDLNGSLLYMSAGGRRLVELNDSEDVTTLTWLDFSDDADKERTRKALADAANGGIGTYQGSFRAKNGTRKSWEMVISPITGENDDAERLVCVFRDITERRLLESQLAQAQKLESIGQLAAGIAHEINTPIQYIGDNGKFLEEAFQHLLELSGDPRPEHTGDLAYFQEEIPKAITQLLEGVEHVTRIVSAMKEFSHPGPLDKALVDINRAIESTIVVSRNEWKYVADLEMDLDPGLPRVPCVAGEFNQVMLNLIVNAAHAVSDVVQCSGGKGRIRISTRQSGDWVEIRVSDTGSGIPEAIQSKVFDPFFTTKPVGKGTGQGLAIAHAVVVRRHRGTISFESCVGTGTTFLIRLPIRSGTEET